MAQRRFHYEQAFEHYLRANRAPYIAVDEAKKTLLPASTTRSAVTDGGASLKSFDFVVYGADENLLIDVKGRKCGRAKARGLATGRLDSWVTRDDVESLAEWQRLFGAGFRAVFVFAYWLDAQPPDALFQEIFHFRDKWYALRQVDLGAYREAMTDRSARWETVHVPSSTFEKISEPLTIRRAAP
ncbi:MAG: HYExAFE family protein [Phycisphaerales bacterium]